MRAETNNFEFIRDNKTRVIVPFFQRPYVWKKDHWKQLLSDLKDSFKENRSIFLGFIILKENDKKIYSIIDGQQRLTTCSILIKILYDFLEQEQRDELDLRNYLFDKTNIKINHSKLDKKKYEKIITGEIIDIKEEKGIFGCFNYFKSEVERLKKEINLYEFAKFITKEENKLWVIIYLDENEDEQKIFDSINSKGQRLSSTDIIKNALFDKIIKITNENKAMEYYQDYWNNVFDKDEATQEFWNKEVETGRIKRSRSEILLHSYATINGIFKSEHSLSHLSSLYKEHIKNLDENKLKQILKELKDYSEIYRDFPDINKETTFKYEKYELRFFHIISVYNINTILPLVLFLKNLLNQKKSIYKECLYLLEALIVCNILCNVSSKDYNKFFPQIIEKIKGKQDNDVIDSIKEAICEKYKDKESFDKDKIKSKLKCIKNNKKATLILFWIELYKREQKKDYKDDTSSLEYNYTLEHLLPQSWETHWSDIIQDEEEAKEFIYQIGNMTLLKGKLNSTLQNNSWNNKLIRIDGKVNTDLLINKELEDKLWTKTEIEKRTSKFIDDFFKIWNVDLFEI